VLSSDAGLCAASRLLCRVGVPVTEPLVSMDADDTEEAGDPRSRLLRDPSSSARSGVCLGILIMVGVPLLLELRPWETRTHFHFLLQTQIFFRCLCYSQSLVRANRGFSFTLDFKERTKGLYKTLF